MDSEFLPVIQNEYDTRMELALKDPMATDGSYTTIQTAVKAHKVRKSPKI